MKKPNAHLAGKRRREATYRRGYEDGKNEALTDILRLINGQAEVAAKSIWEMRNRRDGGTLIWEDVIARRREYPNTYETALVARQEARTALSAVVSALIAKRGAPDIDQHAPIKTEGEWQWWAGGSEEWFTVGPEASRDDVIEAARNDCLGETDDGGDWHLSFHIVEARQDGLRLADWIGCDRMLEYAEDSVADSDRSSSEYDDGPYFDVSPDVEKDLVDRIRRTCDQWQTDHSLVFTCRTFSHTRNSEHVVVDHPDIDTDARQTCGKSPVNSGNNGEKNG